MNASRVGTLVLATLILAAPLGSGEAPAHAAATSAGVVINDGHGWHRDSTAPLFSIGSIVPGWQQERSFEVRNDADSPVDLAVQATNLVEHENGCVHGEAQVDTTCGPDQGELGHELTFTVDVAGAMTPAWSGTLYALTTPVVIAQALPAGQSATVRISAALPWAAGDEIETDTVGFDLRIDSQQDETSVLGETVHRGGSAVAVLAGASPGESGSLATTGIEVFTEMCVAVCLLALGLFLVLLARARRRS